MPLQLLLTIFVDVVAFALVLDPINWLVMAVFKIE